MINGISGINGITYSPNELSQSNNFLNFFNQAIEMGYDPSEAKKWANKKGTEEQIPSAISRVPLAAIISCTFRVPLQPPKPLFSTFTGRVPLLVYGTRRRVHEKSVYPCVYPFTEHEKLWYHSRRPFVFKACAGHVP